jgi:hypothetical protein
MGCGASSPIQHNRAVEDDWHFSRRRNSIIGEGGFGRVYVGYKLDAQHDQVAIKVMEKIKMPDRELALLHHEMVLSMKLQHPGIVATLAVYESKQEISIVMECLNGGELFDRIEEVSSSYGERTAAGLVKQVAAALHYLHTEHSVCHRDLKPENLVFQNNTMNSLKLIDFGLSKAKGKEAFFTQCGTSGFMVLYARSVPAGLCWPLNFCCHRCTHARVVMYSLIAGPAGTHSQPPLISHRSPI